MKPCTRCGQCCKDDLCDIGSIVFPHELPCPALQKDNEGIYFCAFVKAEQEFRAEPVFSKLLGIGVGCTKSSVHTIRGGKGMKIVISKVPEKRTIMTTWGPRDVVGFDVEKPSFGGARMFVHEDIDTDILDPLFSVTEASTGRRISGIGPRHTERLAVRTAWEHYNKNREKFLEQIAANDKGLNQ